MAKPVWDRLSDELRQAFAWAQAIELGDDLGTRSVLIGMMRVRRGDSEPDQILRTFGIAPDELYEALQDATPSWRIDPYVPVLNADAGEPVLTPNVERALRGAGDGLPRDAPLEPAHMLAALLTMRSSTAYRGFARVLRDKGVPIEAVAAAHREHLARPDGRSLEAVLRERFRPDDGMEPGEEHPSDEAASSDASVSDDASTLRALVGVGGPLALSAEGSTVAAVGADGGVVFLDISSGRFAELFSLPNQPRALALSLGGDLLAAAYADGAVLVASTREPLAKPIVLVRSGREHPQSWTALAIAADGRVAAGDGLGRVVEWDGDPGAAPRAFEGAAGPLLGLAYAASGAGLVMLDGAGKLWRVSWRGASREVLDMGSGVLIPASSRRVTVALSPGGRVIVAGAAGGPLRAWEVGERALGRELDAAIVSDGPIAVADDGRVAVTVGRSVRLVQLAPFAPPRPTQTRVEWLSDAHARKDLLGRRALADALAKRLDRMTAAAPGDSFLVHLDGPWGAGKSSILHFLREDLRSRWLLVDFDAWRQSRVGPPWWALLTSLRKAVRRELGVVEGSWLRAWELLARLFRDHAVAPFAGLALAGLLAWLVLGANASELRTGAIAVAAVFGALALLLGYGRGAASFLMWDSASGARRYEQWHRDPMEGLADHFSWLVRRAPKPVLFLVDDLDRCDERHVVDLLDSIQTLVRRDAVGAKPPPAPCFVVAADGRWIRRAYERTHEGFEEAVGEPARPLGYLFLDKLFQLSVDVPAIGTDGQSAYLQELLAPGGGDASPEPAAARRVADSTSQREILAAVHDAQPQERAAVAAAAVEKLSEQRVVERTEHELQKFATVLERNPRSMKRFVNAYSMALSTSLLEGRDVDPDQLALWTIMRLRWPELAERLRERPERLAVFAGEAPAGDEDGALGVLAGAPAVRRVLGFGDGLTPAAIQRLAGMAAEEDAAAASGAPR